MISKLPATAEMFKNCTVHFQDKKIKKVTMLPFFQQNGQISYVLFIIKNDPNLYFISTQNIFKIKLFSNYVDADSMQLKQLDSDNIENFENLYHFDPWWLLKSAPYQNLPITPLLKMTNCFNSLTPCGDFSGKAKTISYARDFSHVKHFMTVEDDTLKYHAFDPAMLMQKAAQQNQIVVANPNKEQSGKQAAKKFALELSASPKKPKAGFSFASSKLGQKKPKKDMHLPSQKTDSKVQSQWVFDPIWKNWSTSE